MWSPVKCIFSPVVLGGILGVALGACANLTARPRVSHHIVGESAPFFKNIAEAQLQLKRGDFFVVVSKKDKKLWLQSLKDPATTLLEFPIVSGLNHGDKQIQGDQKTPEGIYFVTHQLPQERLRKVHGAYAFNLDYPNLLDLREKKTGGGIWIHGVEYEDRVLSLIHI